jgi:Na+-driven multidrug efflux pump
LFKKIIELYSDREYFVNIFNIGWPIALQQLAFAALNMLGVVFVGQKGEANAVTISSEAGGTGPTLIIPMLAEFTVLDSIDRACKWEGE